MRIGGLMAVALAAVAALAASARGEDPVPYNVGSRETCYSWIQYGHDPKQPLTFEIWWNWISGYLSAEGARSEMREVPVGQDGGIDALIDAYCRTHVPTSTLADAARDIADQLRIKR
jgi:hypothetical protein